MAAAEAPRTVGETLAQVQYSIEGSMKSLLTDELNMLDDKITPREESPPRSMDKTEAPP